MLEFFVVVDTVAVAAAAASDCYYYYYYVTVVDVVAVVELSKKLYLIDYIHPIECGHGAKENQNSWYLFSTIISCFSLSFSTIHPDTSTYKCLTSNVFVGVYENEYAFIGNVNCFICIQQAVEPSLPPLPLAPSTNYAFLFACICIDIYKLMCDMFVFIHLIEMNTLTNLLVRRNHSKSTIPPPSMAMSIQSIEMSL